VLPIFDQFIETYKGNVNRRFWNKVCDIKREKIRTGNGCTPSLSRTRTSFQHLTGWLAKLFGTKEILAENLTKVSLPCIYVPVELINSWPEGNTLCHIVGGFHGVYSTENRYKPVMSLSVIEEKDCHGNEDNDYDIFGSFGQFFRQFFRQ
jgi:hypothetical protein